MPASLTCRYTLKTLEAIEYAATHASIANLGSTKWQAGGDSYCNGNGFAARVCKAGGWGEPGTTLEYECGKAPAGTAAAPEAKYRCTDEEIQCLCMPGYSGSRCETGSSTVGVHGFCRPPPSVGDYWLTDTAPDTNIRDPGTCSGHGWCTARTEEEDSTALRYTFCQCDRHWYGEDCSQSELDQDGKQMYAFGDFSNYPDQCYEGMAPRIDRVFIVVTFPAAACDKHGVPIRFAPDSNGKMTYSNKYRPQTPGVCFCEPSFDGEECLGGQAVPDDQGWYAGVCSIVLMLGLAFLYRQRKAMQSDFDEMHVTPSDFSVFVDHLPTLKLDERGAVEEHFSQFGEVHWVTPATDDEVLVALQREKNMVLEKLQIFRENDHYERQMEAWRREQALLRKGGDVEAAKGVARMSKPDMSSLPPLQNLVDPSVLDDSYSDLSSVYRILVRLPIIKNCVLTRAFYFKYLMFLNKQIARELNQPHVEEFHRAFVTFSKASSRQVCLDAYSDRRDGIFGKKKETTRSLTLRGHVLKVEAAPEPEEVLWESLDVGGRERMLRMMVSFLFLCGLIVAMFQIVLLLNESKSGGIIGILIAVAVLALNVFAARCWIKVSEFEQHYNYGSKMRSLYLKTLLTQLCITVLAGTLAVYGYPLDFKNGYIQDWYKEAGGFVFRMILIESVVPPLINVTNLPYRLRVLKARLFAKSRIVYELSIQPSPYILAERCAALMRTVILCCAFNSGLPVLNFAVACGLSIRYWSDKYCMQNLFRLQKSGPQLARVLELTLLFATAVNVVVGWVTLRAGWDSNFITEVIFYIFIVACAWAFLGYFSWKKFRGVDCWLGSGPLLPCTGWLCCFNPTILKPFHMVHRFYMTWIFGEEFWGEEPDDNDETGGANYGDIYYLHNLRKYPYYVYERCQLFPEFDSGEPQPRFMTGKQYLESLKKKKRNPNVVMESSALLEKQKVRHITACAFLSLSLLV